MEPFLVPVIYGSVRTQRQGIRAARYVVRRLTALGMEPTLVDPLEHRLPLLDRMYKEYQPGTAPPALEELAKLFKRADGFVIVSGEYNHSIPPALSNMLDYFLEEYFWRPAGIACYSNGRFGGVRAAVQLRAMLCELGMVTMPSAMPVPNVHDAFDENGVPADPNMDKYTLYFFEELTWYMKAMRTARAQGVPY
jgi:NAD(P)H-dependent FMN reductase